MLKGHAKIIYDEGVLRALVGIDFCRYYLYLFRESVWKTRYFWTPRHGAHITVWNPQFDGFNIAARNYIGKEVNFFYDPSTIHRGGNKKGFEGYYLKVTSPEIEEIRKILKPRGSNGFNGLHISLFSDKHTKSRDDLS